MLSFDSDQRYFVRTTKAAFCEDRERVKTLIDLSHICPWDMKTADYKNIGMKKKGNKNALWNFR